MDERVIGGRYRVQGTLGHGGMASVFRALDETLGREVAVKVFRIGPVDHGERARAEAEIQVLAQLRNPALVTLYDAAIDDEGGDSWLVMELVPGSDLATRLREGPLDPATAARVGAQVADGLAAVHAAGIVHRDVKPANVLVESDGVHVKLADFGIALLRDSARVTGTGTVMGTAAYLAPEQVLAQPISGAADVYALGLVLLECLTGRQPFPGSAVESATARLARSPEIDPSLPTAWRTLLHVMSATDPSERPTAAEAADRLRALGRDDVAPATQLLPGGPAAAAGAAAVAGVAGSAAAAAASDDATRVLPARTAGSGASDDATRVMPAQAPRAGGQDDLATTVLGTPGPSAGGTARGGAGGSALGAPTRAGGTGPDPEPERRRRGWIVWVVVLAVLVVAGIVAAVALGGGGGTPAPTDSGSPSQQQAPSEEPSQPAEQPSQEAPSQEPSEPTEPSEQPSEPTEPSEQPSEQQPSDGPDPGVQPTLPVQTPASSTGQDTTPGGDGAPADAPH